MFSFALATSNTRKFSEHKDFLKKCVCGRALVSVYLCLSACVVGVIWVLYVCKREIESENRDRKRDRKREREREREKRERERGRTERVILRELFPSKIRGN